MYIWIFCSVSMWLIIHSVSLSIFVSIWILCSVFTLHVDPYSISISMSVYNNIDNNFLWKYPYIMPHPMYIDSLYRVHCQPIISSNEKTHNQFAIDNNCLWKYPYIIKVIWNFTEDKVFPYNSMRRFCQNQIS